MFSPSQKARASLLTQWRNVVWLSLIQGFHKSEDSLIIKPLFLLLLCRLWLGGHSGGGRRGAVQSERRQRPRLWSDRPAGGQRARRGWPEVWGGAGRRRGVRQLHPLCTGCQRRAASSGATRTKHQSDQQGGKPARGSEVSHNKAIKAQVFWAI